MDVHNPLALLGGLSPAQFMRRHWQKKPLLVRQALPGVAPPLARPALFALAANPDVESRLVVRRQAAAGRDGPEPGTDPSTWSVRQGPLPRRALPALSQPGWTLLVQGLDLHVPAAHQLLQAFRFVPDARLDDLMVSWASDGGGVGPHLDSYDVFLLQVQGHRRWRIGPVQRPAQAPWVEGAPLKILRQFTPTQEWLLAPGDMLYLPPGWAHDGVAEGECMTCSIGFRAPARDALAAELLQRLADDALDDEDGDRAAVLYRDPRQVAVATPAAIPPALQDYARDAVQRLLASPGALARALGEVLSEPKPQVWFAAEDAGDEVSEAPGRALPGDLVLAAATRMLYDEHHVFINGEAFRAAGRDAQLMRELADKRRLPAAAAARLSSGAVALVQDWQRSGWLRREPR